LHTKGSRYLTPDGRAAFRTTTTDHALHRVRVEDYSLHPPPIHIEGEGGQSRDVKSSKTRNWLSLRDLAFFPGFNTIGFGDEIFDIRVLVIFIDADGDDWPTRTSGIGD